MFSLTTDYLRSANGVCSVTCSLLSVSYLFCSLASSFTSLLTFRSSLSPQPDFSPTSKWVSSEKPALMHPKWLWDRGGMGNMFTYKAHERPIHIQPVKTKSKCSFLHWSKEKSFRVVLWTCNLESSKYFMSYIAMLGVFNKHWPKKLTMR